MDAVVGSNRPTIRLLNKLVKKSAACMWYDLGIELLDPEDIRELDVIQSNHARDAGMCCTKMFQLWLERQPNASWRQLIQALKEVEMNELANTIEQKLMSISEGLMLKASTNPSMPQQQTILQQPLSSPLTFTQDEPVDDAFIRLSAFVTSLIQNANFPSLQRACIEKANSPKMLLKSEKIMPVIKEAQSFDALCSMLANTSYWNFLDTRMMEAMAIASRIPDAQEAIKNFKKTFYNMTLKEAAPYFPVMHAKSDYAGMHEEFDTDPSQMTIGELHKHRFYLENEIIQAGSGTSTIRKIMIGSVVVIWQIHVDHVYRVYCRLKKLHFQLSLHSVRHISIPEMKQWEGLPFLFPGQDIDRIGPIKSSTNVRHKPYPVPQGFEWCVIKYRDCDDIQELNSMSRGLLKWLLSSKMKYLLGIKVSSSKEFAFLLTCTPCNIRIGGKLLPMVYLHHTSRLNPDITTQDQLFQLFNAAIKEAMRILASEGIFQAVMFLNYNIILKPIITFDVYIWDSHLHSIPYTTPRTVGLRRMTSSDVPKALALTNQYTSQFEIAQVFQSEEEFSHWFLNTDPLVDNITTYIVEDCNSGNITDMFSFRTGPRINFESEKFAEVTAMVVTSLASAKEIISDLLVCTEQQNVTFVILPRFGLKKHLFKNFLQENSDACLPVSIHNRICGVFYNFIHPEVDDDDHCLFGSKLHISMLGSGSPPFDVD